MFILLRRIERWLHQHVFKVGWLVTQNYQTTTILYYTVFLPGVVLHEVIYWLAAGVFNVRAEHKIQWPDEQEIGELELNFVKLAPRTGTYRKAFITSAPLLVGLLCIWLVANNIFDITAVVQTMSSGELTDLVAAYQMLTGAPLFWLWVYLIFTIANTMFPSVPKDLRGWRSIFIGLGVVAVALLVLGLGGEIFEALQTPLSQIISVLQSTFLLIMLIDILMVLILGLIEYTIERSTGRSATFRRGKMITMTREEAIEEREKQREREQKKRERELRKQQVQTTTTSIYELAFEIPGGPKDFDVTGLEPLEGELPDTSDDVDEIEDAETAPSMPVFGGLANDGKPAKRELSEEEKAQRAAIAERVNLPKVPSVPKPSDYTPDDADGDDNVGMQPAASSMSRFGRPDAPTTIPTEQEMLGEADSGDERDEQPAARTTSRFGRPVSATSAPRVDEDDTESIDEDIAETSTPAASSSSRFGRFVAPVPATQPSTPAESPDDEADSTEAEDTPAARVSLSRFGRPLSPVPSTDADESDEVENETSTTDEDGDKSEREPITSRFGRPLSPVPKPESDSEADDADTEDEQAVSSTSRFGRRSSATSTPTSPKERETTDTADSTSTETDDSAEPAARTVSRFGKPLSPPAPLVDKSVVDKADEDEAAPPAAEADEVIAVVGRPASPGLFDETADEDDETIDNDRRQEGDDAVGSLFAQLNSDDDADDDDESAGQAVASTRSRFSFLGGDDDADDDDTDEDESLSTRFGRGSSRDFGSRFGSRPAMSRTDSDDANDDDIDEDESLSTRFGRSSSERFGSRFGRPSFGSSRPAPKPSAKEDDTADDSDTIDNDEIVYEDIDDVPVYDYEDDEDYVDYDEDEYYYDDEDI